ncbi:MAG: carboxyl-terminal processing protease, partial [Candidatus Promineifilaceae bacterium]
MSERAQNILVISLAILLPILTFVAGFMTNEVFDMSLPFTKESSQLISDADSAGFDLFWEAWGHIEETYIGDVPTGRNLTYAAIQGALVSLNDPYSRFLEPVVRQEEIVSLSGNYGGIGVYVKRNEIGEAWLIPIPNNPAAEAGVEEGDILLEINDETVSGDLSISQIEQLLRGEVGDDLELTLDRNGKVIELEIVIGQILVPSVFARILSEAPAIGYIQLSRFSAETSEELEKAILNFETKGVKGIILDLRGNGGGLLDASVEVADHFLEDGIILRQESRSEGEKIYNAHSGSVAADIPTVVLMDAGTASAAEIVAGALQDQSRALLIGTKSYGKGSVQLVYDLSDGSSIHVTSARWFTPNGTQIDQQGLFPDVPVDLVAASEDLNKDYFIQTGIDNLSKI